MVPHVGETDTDTLTEIPGRCTEADEENEPKEEEEEEDEFGYSWSEFTEAYSVQTGAGKVAVCLKQRFVLLAVWPFCR